jgi:hypothetical protein
MAYDNHPVVNFTIFPTPDENYDRKSQKQHIGLTFSDLYAELARSLCKCTLVQLRPDRVSCEFNCGNLARGESAWQQQSSINRRRKMIETCRHCGKQFTPMPGKPGFIDECAICIEERTIRLPDKSGRHVVFHRFKPKPKYGYVPARKVGGKRRKKQRKRRRTNATAAMKSKMSSSGDSAPSTNKGNPIIWTASATVANTMAARKRECGESRNESATIAISTVGFSLAKTD